MASDFFVILSTHLCVLRAWVEPPEFRRTFLMVETTTPGHSDLLPFRLGLFFGFTSLFRLDFLGWFSGMSGLSQGAGKKPDWIFLAERYNLELNGYCRNDEILDPSRNQKRSSK